MPVVEQFTRYAGIGFLNTAVDYAVFNLIASATGVYTGLGAGIITAVSFTIAVLHSYFWNKYWAFGTDQNSGAARSAGQFVVAGVFGIALIGTAIFGASQKYGAWYFVGVLVVLAIGEIFMWKLFHLAKINPSHKSVREFLVFIFISLVGTLINTQILIYGTNLIPPQFGLNQELWTNLIKVGATGIAMMWNFAGYKLFVFRR